MSMNAWRGTLVLVSCTFVLGGALAAHGAPSFAIDDGFLYGPSDGFLQTPKGGQPGTTSSRRPTLHELGFHEVSIYELSLRADWGAHTLYAGGQFLRLQGKSTLTSDLTSWEQYFPAGDSVDAHMALDWYRFGLFRHFDLSPAERPGTLTLSPGGEAVSFFFHYRLEGPEGTADRAYAKGGVRLGADMTWNITDRLLMTADAFDSLPVPNSASILSAEALVGCRLWQTGFGKGVGYLGVAYDRLDYEDLQTVPNHIRVETGPMLKVGLNISF